VSELKKTLPGICVGTLSRENVILAKMLHRAKNQHRHDLSFQKISGVCRKVKKYLPMNLQLKLKALVNQLFSVKVTEVVVPASVVEAVQELYPQILEAATFSADLLQFIEGTWREVNQRLVGRLFVPFNTVMLASLSRIWVCLRCHLLGLAETYAALKNTVPQVEMPVSQVVAHLKESQRSYLGTPCLRHLQPPPSDPSPSEQQCGPLRGIPPVAAGDTGVAVTLTEEELEARARDFQTVSSLTAVPSTSAELHPASGATVCRESARVKSKCKTTSKPLSGGKNRWKKRKKWLKPRTKLLIKARKFRKTPKQAAISQLSKAAVSRKLKCKPTADGKSVQPEEAAGSGPTAGSSNRPITEQESNPNKKTTPGSSKKKRCGKEVKRLQRKGHRPRFPLAEFRRIMVSHRGKQKMIFGKKVLAERLAKREAARKKSETNKKGSSQATKKKLRLPLMKRKSETTASTQATTAARRKLKLPPMKRKSETTNKKASAQATTVARKKLRLPPMNRKSETTNKKASAQATTVARRKLKLPPMKWKSETTNKKASAQATTVARRKLKLPPMKRN
jgi:hypothetical protein